MVLPIVGAALIALFVATHPRSARATNEPNKPQSDLGMGFLFLGGLAVATAYLVAVDGLGLVVPIRYNIAAFGIFMIALGMLQKTPDADRLPTTPTGRWLAVRWRWGYLSLTGARATVALFSSDTSLPLMLLIPAQSTLPGELWGRERRMPLREERR